MSIGLFFRTRVNGARFEAGISVPAGVLGVESLAHAFDVNLDFACLDTLLCCRIDDRRCGGLRWTLENARVEDGS